MLQRTRATGGAACAQLRWAVSHHSTADSKPGFWLGSEALPRATVLREPAERFFSAYAYAVHQLRSPVHSGARGRTPQGNETTQRLRKLEAAGSAAGFAALLMRDRAERALAWFTVALGFFFAGIGTWTSLT